MQQAQGTLVPSRWVWEVLAVFSQVVAVARLRRGPQVLVTVQFSSKMAEAFLLLWQGWKRKRTDEIWAGGEWVCVDKYKRQIHNIDFFRSGTKHFTHKTSSITLTTLTQDQTKSMTWQFKSVRYVPSIWHPSIKSSLPEIIGQKTRSTLPLLLISANH